ncbi:TPA: hypothetical protein ACOEBE_003723 [Stenotrophomonas maltophilia]
MAAAYRFAAATGSPRGASFLRLLAAHGADLDGPVIGEESLIQAALREQRADLVRIIENGGADVSRLSPTQQAQMRQLLKRSPPELAQVMGQECVLL